MNLTSGKLFWIEGKGSSTYETLRENITCDVLIIGGGVSGAMCAYFLTLAGMKVVIVDKRDIGMGSSSANTGLLQFCSDKTLTSCMNSIGTENGVWFYKLCEKAIIQLKEIVSTLDIDPQFISRNSLYFASSREDKMMLIEEYKNLLQFGFDVTYEQNSISFPFAKDGSIYSKGDAEINPYLLVQGILAKVVDMGAKVYNYTEIIHHKKKDKLIFHTKDNIEIHARKGIFTTGYESQEMRKEKNSILSSSYAIVTNPVPELNWKDDCLIWETARPYLYIRRTKDRRIIIGGLDEENMKVEERECKLLHKRELLVDKLNTFFPGYHVEAQYWWGAVFGSTHSGLPMVQEYEGYEDCYFLLGYGGNGTVYSVILAQMIRDLIIRGYSINSDLFLNKK